MKGVKELAVGAAIAALALAAAACTIKNVEVHGAYGAAGIQQPASPLAATMFNAAYAGMELPAGAVASGDYVGIYRLASGKGDDPWWVYLAEDHLVTKVSAAGATVLERNAAAAAGLEREAEFFEPPRTGRAAGTAPLSPKESRPTPYRATRALEYRVVSAFIRMEPSRSEPMERTGGGPTIITDDAIVAPGVIITDDAIITRGASPRRHMVRLLCEVRLNLRTVDVRTGEVLWTGSTVGKATADVPLRSVVPGMGDEWDEGDIEDEEDMWPWLWYWNADSGVRGPAPMPPPAVAPAPEGEEGGADTWGTPAAVTTPGADSIFGY